MKGSDNVQIIVYSEVDAATVVDNLGQADYSYYFIFEKYLPVLAAIGDVVPVRDPAVEVDELYEKASKRGEKSVFLSFTPPHRTPGELRCPTVCVLAWEFDSIPDEDWDADQPWQNWVTAIKSIGNIITISDYATKVIRRQVGRRPNIVTIPAPVIPSSFAERLARREPPQAAGSKQPIRLTAAIIDSDAMHIAVDMVTPKASNTELLDYEQSLWDGHPVDWTFGSDSGSTEQYLVGFYGEEDWGCWSKTARPGIVLPWSIVGEVELTLELVAHGENQGRTLEIKVGEEVATVILQPELATYTMPFSLAKTANSVYFSGIRAVSAPGARDHRTLGIGLSRLSLRQLGSNKNSGQNAAEMVGDDISPETDASLCLRGIVYTSVFNPADGRKNWHDIVTAFCWAFRDDATRTLVLKMSHHNRSAFLGKLLLLFSRLSPFQCRIIAIHGYLPIDQLESLKENTDYFVNASTAEGQCLPLLEFMAEGIPALAPDHTAMETYINADNAFVVRSSRQPQIWPNDPRRAYRTTTYRINWYSLYEAFQQSALILDEDASRYSAMSQAAAASVRKHYATGKITRKLRAFLNKTSRRC